MDQIEKLNFIVDGLKRTPDLIDDVFKQVALSLDDRNLDDVMRRTEHSIKQLREMEKHYCAKDNSAPGETLLGAIWYAFFFNRLLPDWVRREFNGRFESYKSYNVKSFQDAFRLEQRRNFAKRRNKYFLRKQVKSEVDRLHKLGWPIDQNTFSHIGEKFKFPGEEKCMSGGTVSNYFYEKYEK